MAENMFNIVLILSFAALCHAQEPTYEPDNPLGQCDCQYQFFVGQGCQEFFYCSTEDFSDGGYTGNGGWMITCPDGEIISQPDDGSALWECGPPDNARNNCPGTFSTACAAAPFAMAETSCSCPDQILVNEDCTQSYNCLTNEAPFTCPAGQMVRPNTFGNWGLECVDDTSADAYCPASGGGYQFGCTGDCTRGQTNTVGTCSCDQDNNQLFVSDDCKSSFICTDYVEGDGCSLTCPNEGEFVSWNRETGVWECIAAGAYTCPGSWTFDCPSDLNSPSDFPDFHCECPGQVWVNGDCSKVFICEDEDDENHVNPGYTLNCDGAFRVTPATESIDCLDLDEITFDYTCLGPYHFGCPAGQNTGDNGDNTGGDGASTVQLGVVALVASGIAAMLF